MLRRLLGPFEIRDSFRWLARAGLVREDLREDLSFLRALQRFVAPLPWVDGEHPLSTDLFPPFRPFRVAALDGKKVGVVATGGSGAMVCALGVIRACEEAGLDLAGISSCSGSALALAPVAAGLDAQQAAEFILGWRDGEHLELDRGALRRMLLDRWRRVVGVTSAAPLERLLVERLGDLRLGELPLPFYANVWDIDHTRVLFLGARTSPELPLALATRAAVSLAGFVSPVRIDGAWCSDGGIVNIFPVDPLVDHHPEIDYYIGVNAFYPEGFAGEDITGWYDEPGCILRGGRQTYTCTHIEVARQQLRRIEDRCLLLHPLSYREVDGLRLYELMLDRTRWPEFITAGHRHARAALEALDG